MLIESYKLYRDGQGKLRKTSSGHYRFDLILSNEDGSKHSYVMGYRLDYEQRRILPVTIPRGNSIYTVAEIAPGQHDKLVKALCLIIDGELEDERVAQKG